MAFEISLGDESSPLERQRVVESAEKRWNEKYKSKESAPGGAVNPLLKRHIRLIPRGKALDIAAGNGRNAVFLAQHGFDVEAVDISSVGLRQARRVARDQGVKIKTVHADLDHFQIEKERYDLITEFYFLDRRLIPRIRKGLKKGGKIFFETYLLDQKLLEGGPKNPRYLLKPNELLRLFAGFRILLYREGVFRTGGRRKAIASLIAEKTE